MILDRLSVRQRVNVLAVIPLMVVLLLEIPLLAARLDDARSASRIAETARTARDIGQLVEQLQQARQLSVAYLGSRTVPPNQLVVQLQDVEDHRTALLSRLDATQTPALVTALGQVRLVEKLGNDVTNRGMAASSAEISFSTLINPLINALDLGHATGGSAQNVTGLRALDPLLRADEAASRYAAALLIAATSASDRSVSVGAAHDRQQAEDAQAGNFRRLAGPADVQLFDLADTSDASARLDVANQQLGGLASLKATPPTLAADVFSAGRTQTGLRQLVELRIAQQVLTSAQDGERSAQLLAAGLAATGLAILIVVVLMSVTIGRSVSSPLRRLTDAAGAVADLAQEELLRVADEDVQVATAPRLAAIQVRSQDEIGDLAAAFNRVQATAALLLERQVTSRRNVASMFASVGRRTSNLVGRQLSLIDALERAEEDPDTLATLYRLDHTSTRLRRSASSLVVLSGGTENIGESQPLPVADVVRAALGTVEDYRRVMLRRLPKQWVSPGVVSDLALLLAELLENAVTFSPPRSQVEVVGSMARDGGCTLSVIDRGMGMPAHRLAEENSRLQRRERLDLAPSDVLGLFVVGRISRRHGITVELAPTNPTGVTAAVALPSRLLVDGRAAANLPSRPGSRRRDAAAAAGATRRELAARASRSGTASAAGRSPSPARSSAPAGSPPAPTAPAAPAAVVGEAPGTDSTLAPSGLQRRIRGANWPGGRIEPLEGAAESPRRAAATPPVPPPPPGGEGLARRVPGHNLSAFGSDDEPEGTAGAAGAGTGGPTERATPSTGVISPEAARRQVEEVEQALQRARQVAEHGEPPPPPPSPAETAARSGFSRRVPGAALQALDGASGDPRHPSARSRGDMAAGSGPAADTASTGTPGGVGDGRTGAIDAELLRAALNDVDLAVSRAGEAEPMGSVTAQRRAEEEAQAALRNAQGASDAQRETVEALVAELVTGGIPLSGSSTAAAAGNDPAAGADPAADPAGADPAPGAPEVAVRPVVRRVPGASLAALAANEAGRFRPAHGVGGADAANGTSASASTGWPTATSGARAARDLMPSTPRTGPIALSPERPEAVLAWAEDLETAMARLPRREGTGSKEDGTQEDGTGGGSPSGTDNSQDRGASPQGAGSGSATRPGDDRDGTEGDQG